MQHRPCGKTDHGLRVSRRRFLSAAGAGLSVPVVVPASAMGAGGTTAPSNRIGMGVIGLGRQAIAHNSATAMPTAWRCSTRP